MDPESKLQIHTDARMFVQSMYVIQLSLVYMDSLRFFLDLQLCQCKQHVYGTILLTPFAPSIGFQQKKNRSIESIQEWF